MAMTADVPVSGKLPRWAILPADPPKLRAWLAARQAEQAAYEPLPPVPEEPER